MPPAAPSRSGIPAPGIAVGGVVVLLEPGRAGAAAIGLARDLAERDGATLTVLGVVPQVASGARCGISTSAFNRTVQDAVAMELDEARGRLASLGGRARFALLIEGTDPPLGDWIAAGAYELILLPARRRMFRSAMHPAAASLRRRCGQADVRIIDARPGRSAPA